jgi:hypothetical protein
MGFRCASSPPVSLVVIATRDREFYCWTQKGSCDSAMVWCHLVPNRGGVAGNGGFCRTEKGECMRPLAK